LIALGAGAIGALAMVLILAAAGVLGDEAQSGRAVQTASEPDDADAAARVAAAAGQSVVGIIAATPMGPRRASGVYVRNGEVITSVHAVEGADGLTVVEADGSRRAGSVVGVDDSTGLALVRVASGAAPAKLAASDDLKVGQWILALGGTDGSGSWVASGVVASMGGWADDGSGAMRPGMILVDARTPLEARGGALLDRRGHVVGVLAGTTGDDANGLATPIATVRDVAAQLSEKGRAAHGALGVHAVDEDQPRGARVASVAAGSAAAEAGVAAGDVIVEVDGAPIRSVADLVVAVRLRQPADRVPVVLVRQAKQRRMTVVLGTASAQQGQAPATTVSTSG
jgi:S1-C subfamily serine protease